MLIATARYSLVVLSSVLAFSSLLTVAPSRAQLPRPQPPRYVLTPQFTNEAYDVYAADLDGDGDSDILSASNRDDKIAWYENFNGRMGSQQIIAADVNGAKSVVAADIDGDGDLDVVATSQSETVWFENLNGSRDFSPKRVVSAESRAVDVATADLDGDGDIDILRASRFGTAFVWYENLDGVGDFSEARVLSPSRSRGSSIHSVDIDMDGDLDVLGTLSSADAIVWYENLDGEGGFSDERVISPSVDGARSVHTADLDGDGDPDVVAGGTDDDTILWFENTDGDATFSASKTISTTADGAWDVYAADLDGDGDLEVLSASFNNNAINIYDNQINESSADADGFGPTVQLTNEAFGAIAVHTSDLDMDGDADVLAASFSDDTISYFENRVNEGFGFPTETIVMPSARADAPRKVIAADLNGDGALDIVTASANDDKIAWHLNDGTQWFAPQQVVATGLDFAWDVDAGDLDGDGDMDLVSTSYNDDTIAWFENTDGNGTFAEAVPLTTSADGASSVSLADVDGDGDLDVLATSDRDDTVAWFENTDGDGSFSSENTIWTAANGADQVVAADLDGDGDLDAIAASRNDNTVAWFENTDGAGAFSNEQVVVDDAAGVVDVHAADLDGDGDVDLLYASFGDNVVNWVENTDGDGTFSEPREITNLVRGPTSVHTADLNGDGRLDVITGSSSDDKVAWYLQTVSFGTIDFADQKIITTASDRVQDVFTADLDGDGDIDVLSASDRDDEVAWYENTATTLPVELAAFTATTYQSSVLLEWSTASELNNAGFEIQMRHDINGPFAAQGFVDGHGTTTEAQTYRFRVDDLSPGTYAFRLNQVDVDGAAELSPVVDVTVAMRETHLLSDPAPNPFRGEAWLTLQVREAQSVRADLYDVLGRRVATLHDGVLDAGREHRLSLDGHRLSSGMYFVRVVGERFAETRRVVVAR